MKGLRTDILLVVLVFGLQSKAQKEDGDIDLGCPQESYRFNNTCYELKKFSADYEDSLALCNVKGGTLADVKTDDEYYVVQKLRIRLFVMNYWIGLNNKAGSWLHGDLTNITGYDNWYPNEPTYLMSRSCGLLMMEDKLAWYDRDCDNQFLYICEVPVDKCESEAPAFGSNCYVLSKELVIYEVAERKCKQSGGALANVKNKAINDFLEKLIYAERWWKDLDRGKIMTILSHHDSRMPYNWISLHLVDGKWQYSDGTNLGKYNQWKSDLTIGSEKNRFCVKTDMYWFDYSCYAKYRPICQYPVKQDADARQEDKDARIKKNEITKLTTSASMTFAKQDASVQEDTDVRISEVRLGFSLFGCFILGATVTVLAFFALRYFRRNRHFASKRLHDHHEPEN